MTKEASEAAILYARQNYDVEMDRILAEKDFDAGAEHERKRILEAISDFKSNRAGYGEYNQGLIDGQILLADYLKKIIKGEE